MTKANGRGVNRKGRSKKGGRFVPIPHDMLSSVAWRSLGGAAVKVYVELRSRFNGGNNGDLSLSMDEAARLLHMSKATVWRAFVELEEKGFIAKTKPGHWYGRRATTWAVSDRPHGPQPPTNAWRDWRPKNNSSVPRRDIFDADGPVSGPIDRAIVPLQDPSEHFSANSSSRLGTDYTALPCDHPELERTPATYRDEIRRARRPGRSKG